MAVRNKTVSVGPVLSYGLKNLELQTFPRVQTGPPVHGRVSRSLDFITEKL
jgi:hypothetical protein